LPKVSIRALGILYFTLVLSCCISASSNILLSHFLLPHWIKIHLCIFYLVYFTLFNPIIGGGRYLKGCEILMSIMTLEQMNVRVT
jgi:hypothetical protein